MITLREFIAERGDQEYLFLGSRKKRMPKYPFKTIYLGLLRRFDLLLVNLHIWSPIAKVKTFYGDVLQIPFGHFRPGHFGFYDGNDIFLTDFLIRHLKEGDIFLDGGANIGWFTSLASKLVGPKGQVHAFEPTPEICALLKENEATNLNVFVNQKALGKTTGTIEFNHFGLEESATNSSLPLEDVDRHDELQGGDYQKMQVPSITIDEYCQSLGIVPTFIKLDTEGTEYDILLGARNTLKHHPGIAVEIIESSVERGSAKKIFDLLAGYSYQAYELTTDFTLKKRNDQGESIREFDNVIFLADS